MVYKLVEKTTGRIVQESELIRDLIGNEEDIYVRCDKSSITTRDPNEKSTTEGYVLYSEGVFPEYQIIEVPNDCYNPRF